VRLRFQLGWYIASLILAFPALAWANIVVCKIEIEDIKNNTTYSIEEKFSFTKPNKGDYPVVGRKRFELPGNNYICTFAFFGLKSGTMISCEYKGDLSHTFFASDRSALNDGTLSNNLRFRHGSAFIDLHTICE